MTVATIYKLAFQVTPIWLTGGRIDSPGGKLPFAMLTDPDLYKAVAGSNWGIAPTRFTPTGDSPAWDLDNAFGAFQVLPGGTLVQQTPATFPFANQTVASNATIFEPLTLSLIWDTPMRGEGAWAKKFSVIQNVQARLTDHNNYGGTYTVITPSFIYEDMILTGMADASRGQNSIPQNAWRFDFQKPLVRITDLAAAQAVLMAKLTNGAPTDGSWSGVAAGQGLHDSLVQFMSQSVVPMPSAQGTLTGVPT